jgi:tryptophan-rich sensory protein
MKIHSSRFNKIASFFIVLAICYSVASSASWFTQQGIESWYPLLKKPFWTPPNLVFPIVWTILYTMMAISFWLVLHKTQQAKIVIPFAVQLLLNFFWSLFFFGYQQPLLGLIDIILLIAAIVWTILAFFPYSKAAAWLLIPYLAWVVYASTLNAYIWYHYVHPGP